MLLENYSEKYRTAVSDYYAEFSENGEDVRDDVCGGPSLTFLYIRENDGRYRRMEEHQRQRAWNMETLKEILWKAGFRAVCMYSNGSLNAAKEQDERWHIAATNPVK